MCHSQSQCQSSYLDENLSYLLLIYHNRSGSNIHMVERVLFQFGSAIKLCSCQPQKITVFLFFIGVQLDYSIWLVNLIHLIAKKFQKSFLESCLCTIGYTIISINFFILLDHFSHFSWAGSGYGNLSSSSVAAITQTPTGAGTPAPSSAVTPTSTLTAAGTPAFTPVPTYSTSPSPTPNPHRQKCYKWQNSFYCTGQYSKMKAVCKDGYCVCTGQGYNYDTCLRKLSRYVNESENLRYRVHVWVKIALLS